MNINAFGIVAISLLLAACGSDSSSSGTDDGGKGDGGQDNPIHQGSLEGKLTNIEGLGFETQTVSGITGSDGIFTYEEGETITLLIGGTQLVTLDAKAVLTLDDIISAILQDRDTLPSTEADIRELMKVSNADDEVSQSFYKASNLTRLLMLLDEDRNPENGFELSDWNDKLVNTQFDLTLPISNFSELKSKLENDFDLSVSIDTSAPLVYLYNKAGITVPAHRLTNIHRIRAATEYTQSEYNFEYDSQGRLIKDDYQYRYQNGPFTSQTAYEYAFDDTGNMTSKREGVHQAIGEANEYRRKNVNTYTLTDFGLVDFEEEVEFQVNADGSLGDSKKSYDIKNEYQAARLTSEMSMYDNGLYNGEDSYYRERKNLEYNDKKQLIEKVAFYEYLDNSLQSIREDDSSNTRYFYTYSGAGLMTQEKRLAYSGTNSTDPSYSRTSDFEYNSQGQETLARSINFNGSEFSYEKVVKTSFNDSGLLTEMLETRDLDDSDESEGTLYNKVVREYSDALITRDTEIFRSNQGGDGNYNHKTVDTSLQYNNGRLDNVTVQFSNQRIQPAEDAPYQSSSYNYDYTQGEFGITAIAATLVNDQFPQYGYEREYTYTYNDLGLITSFDYSSIAKIIYYYEENPIEDGLAYLLRGTEYDLIVKYNSITNKSWPTDVVFLSDEGGNIF